MAIFGSFKRKGGGALTHKVTAELAKQPAHSSTCELGATSFLNARTGGAASDTSGPSVAFSSASYQANDPCADSLVLEVRILTNVPHMSICTP